MKNLFATILLVFCLAAKGQTTSSLFDFGWKFIEQDVADAQSPTLNDKDWQRVDLPHDWDIHHSPYAEAPMGNDGGYYPGGIGWYRKTFKTPSGAQVVKLHFEGVYQKSRVYVNGTLAGTHGYGYTPFTVDMTPYLNKDRKSDNVVAVRVDNSTQPNCRWYSGSGIYRHVWLQASEALHMADDGICVTTPEVSDNEAKVSVSVTVANASATPREASVAVGGATRKVVVAAGGTQTVALAYTIARPRLWSPESPNLYTAHVALSEGGRQIESRDVRFGVRTFSFDAERGFVLNGKQVPLNGACVHHDDGVLGAAAYDRAEIRKVRLMKEAGFNLIRTSHNPSTRAFLDACDSIGMLVIDEAFDNWYKSKTKYDYSTLIDSCWREDIASLVVRDRNHPSVICWSIGNEVIERRSIDVVTTARKFRAEVLRNDSTRPVTEALCSWDRTDREWPLFDPHAEALDIVGYNYMIHHHKDDHKRVPQRVMWQTESYPRDAFKNWSNVADNAYIVGDIVWTGLDYLGESGIGRYYYKGESEGEHYSRPHFPWHGAYCGDVDITGWRKPISHYREMLWRHDGANTVYMAVKEPNGYCGDIRETLWSVWPTWESWNWKGHEGKPIDVEVYTKAPAVRLYLNGKVLGEKAVSRATEFKAVFPVPYEAGTLRAVALDANGNETAEATLQTAGNPAKLRLAADRKSIAADGQDLAFITVEVVDGEGRVVPDASLPVSVKLTGQGSLLAAASADLKDLEPMVSPRVTTWKGRAMIVVRSTQKAGAVKVTALSSLPTATINLSTRR